MLPPLSLSLSLTAASLSHQKIYSLSSHFLSVFFVKTRKAISITSTPIDLMALLFLFLVLLSYYYSNCKWAMKGRERKEEKKSAQHNTIITRAYPSKSLECSRFASASSTVVASIQSHFCPFQKERIKIFKTVKTVYVCADTVVGWMGGYW